MVDVRGDVLRSPHSTTPAAVTSNKNLKWDPLRKMKTIIKFAIVLIQREIISTWRNLKLLSFVNHKEKTKCFEGDCTDSQWPFRLCVQNHYLLKNFGVNVTILFLMKVLIIDREITCMNHLLWILSGQVLWNKWHTSFKSTRTKNRNIQRQKVSSYFWGFE